MKSIFMMDELNDIEETQKTAKYFIDKIENYIDILKKDYELNDMPEHVIWTSDYVMTHVFKKNVPAFTNEKGIFMNIEKESWKTFLNGQIKSDMSEKTQKIFNNYLEKEMLCILGHEITHHCDFFLTEFDDLDISSDDLWFEEGLVTFLPRYYLYNDKEFKEIIQYETELFNYYKSKYDENNLESFTYEIYKSNDNAYVMFHYWKSFLAIVDLVENYYEGNIHKMIKQYQQWNKEGKKQKLSEYLFRK